MTDNLYLITAKVTKSPYMGRDTTFDDMRIVWAPTGDVATEKYLAFWEAKGSAYEVSYNAKLQSITSAIR